MFKALSGIVISALLVGLSQHTPVWTEVSQPQAAQQIALPTFQTGPSKKAMPRVPPDAIRKLSCGAGWGTGVAVSRDIMITANHVVAGAPCVDDETKEPLVIEYRNASQDFAIVKIASKSFRNRLKVSCSGYVEGQTYYAYGYAGVGPGDLSMFRVRATNEVAPETSIDPRTGTIFVGTRVLSGTIIPGMSGGPVLNTRGQVVGINNATGDYYRVGLSRQLSETILCLSYGDVAKRNNR